MNFELGFGFLGVVLLLLVILLVFVSCVKIVPQAQAMVVERLGAYLDTWHVGVHFKTPFIDRVAKKVILKEQVVDFPPQPVITKDNVTMKIDTVVFFQITDPKLYTYGVENPIMAIENLTATTLRNIIGDLELDQTLTSRETINTKMRAALDVATDPWVDRFGEPPAEAVALLDIALLRSQASEQGISEIKQQDGRLLLTFAETDFARLSALCGDDAFRGRLLLNAGSSPYLSLRLNKGEQPLDMAETLVEKYAATA